MTVLVAEERVADAGGYHNDWLGAVNLGPDVVEIEVATVVADTDPDGLEKETRWSVVEPVGHERDSTPALDGQCCLSVCLRPVASLHRCSTAPIVPCLGCH